MCECVTVNPIISSVCTNIFMCVRTQIIITLLDIYVPIVNMYNDAGPSNIAHRSFTLEINDSNPIENKRYAYYHLTIHIQERNKWKRVT